MRRTALLLCAAGLSAAAFAPAAEASITCSDWGPLPGYGPVCTARCVAGSVDTDPSQVNPKDPIRTVAGIVVIDCPA
jgi:hypothetical protein